MYCAYLEPKKHHKNQEPQSLSFNKDQLKSEGKPHTNHLMSAKSFPGPKKNPLVSSHAGQTWHGTKGFLNGINCTCYQLSSLSFLCYQGIDAQLQAITMKSY